MKRARQHRHAIGGQIKRIAEHCQLIVNEPRPDRIESSVLDSSSHEVVILCKDAIVLETDLETLTPGHRVVRPIAPSILSF